MHLLRLVAEVEDGALPEAPRACAALPEPSACSSTSSIALREPGGRPP